MDYIFQITTLYIQHLFGGILSADGCQMAR